jgi:hypothetical protein
MSTWALVVTDPCCCWAMDTDVVPGLHHGPRWHHQIITSGCSCSLQFCLSSLCPYPSVSLSLFLGPLTCSSQWCPGSPSAWGHLRHSLPHPIPLGLHGARRCLHGARRCLHGARRCLHGARRCLHGARRCLHGARLVVISVSLLTWPTGMAP